MIQVENVILRNSLNKTGHPKMRPDIDFNIIDWNWDNIQTLFQSQSIGDIREKLMGVVKVIFEKLQAIFMKCKKLFYFATLIFLIYDGYK